MEPILIQLQEYVTDKSRSYVDTVDGVMSIRKGDDPENNIDINLHLFTDKDGVSKSFYYPIPIYDFATHWYGKTYNKIGIESLIVENKQDDIYLLSNYYDEIYNTDSSISIESTDFKFILVKYPECKARTFIADISDDDYNAISDIIYSHYKGAMTSGIFRTVYNNKYKK